jgi:hypothetical protein
MMRHALVYNVRGIVLFPICIFTSKEILLSEVDRIQIILERICIIAGHNLEEVIPYVAVALSCSHPQIS